MSVNQRAITLVSTADCSLNLPAGTLPTALIVLWKDMEKANLKKKIIKLFQ